MNIIKATDSLDIPKNYTGIVEFPYRTKCWYKDGKIHREDGPAIEWTNGEKEWWFEGKEYFRINLKDYVVLDHCKGKFGIIWYKLLYKDEIIDYPDIPGLVTK